MYVLTREDARHRSAVVTVRHIDVTLHLEEAATENSSYRVLSRMTLVSQEPTLFVDVAGKVQVVSIDDVPLAPDQFTYDGERLDISAVPTNREVTISVEADCRFSTTGEGLHRYRDPEDGRYYLYTQFEPEDAHRAWPCFDQPDMKPTWSFHVYAPCEWVVTSNGIGSSKDCGNGITLWDFTTTPPLSSYITAVVAGQWALVEGGSWQGSAGDGNSATLQLRLLCRQALASSMDSDDILAVTRAGLDHYHEHYGYTFPWGSYDQIFVPEYNLGAMENPGCITFNENYLSRDTPSFALRQKRANTILHEMCHMWFGDLVTPAWWENLWLKESFAENQGTTTAAEATIYTGEWASFAIGRKAWALGQDQYPTTHPIVADIPDIPAAKNNFDGITYAKGAAVLKQLVAWVGEETFYEGVRLYFQRFANSSTGLEDLLGALEEASGENLGKWKDAWLLTTGPSTLSLSWTSDDAGRLTGLHVYQEGLARPHSLDISFWTANDGVLLEKCHLRVRVEEADSTVDVPLELTQTGSAQDIDLVVVNDLDLTYAISRFDEHSMRTALTYVSTIERPITRAVIWSNLFSALRGGELDPRDYIHAALAHMAEESEDAIFERLLATISIARSFLPHSSRDCCDREILNTLAEFMRRASRDRGRATLRLFVDVWIACGDETYTEAVLELANGRHSDRLPLIEGEESTWDLRRGCAARGLVTEKELESWLEASPTGENRTRWIRSRAALPDADIRSQVWNEICHGSTMSNLDLSASLQGLNDSTWSNPGYVTQYFSQLLPFWKKSSMGLGLRFVEDGFPMSIDIERQSSDENPIEAAKIWLDKHSEVAPALTRLIIEKLDDLERASSRQKQWR